GLRKQNFSFLRSRASLLCGIRASTRFLLLFQPIAEFLDHRVGQYFFSDPLDLRRGSSFVQPTIDHQLEEFSLPNGADALVTHLLEGALDGLPLRIKDCAL